ncbi:MAG TPA: class I SAM-dependent methyltransferase [Myxococcales bacterium]|nr:class I SAM-dependent methyltransferase [Myxococcales bacterium]
MSAWWRGFFDEDYPVLYAPALDPEKTEREVAGAAAILRLEEGARILDLCCGTGRHAVALQRRGMHVTGLDSSKPLLALAREKASRVGSFPKWLRGDARDLPFRSASFDAAICLFNSIGYGTDAEALAMLREARRCAPALLLEAAHRDEHVRNGGAGITYEWTERPGVRVLVERWIEPLPGLSRAIFRIQRPGQPDVVKEFRHRLYSATELVALLRRAGYERVECFGGYQRQGFGIDSPVFLAHAR